MTVLGRGLIFQPVLASLPYIQTCTYNNDTIITLQNILPLQIFHQNYGKKPFKNHDTVIKKPHSLQKHERKQEAKSPDKFVHLWKTATGVKQLLRFT